MEPLNPLPENEEDVTIPAVQNNQWKKSYNILDEDAETNEYFIKTVKKYPWLYNNKDRNSKNESMKLATWATIGKKFDATGTECMSKWNFLRQKYARVRKKQLSGQTGQDFPFYDSLDFLNPYIGIRRPKTRFKFASSNRTEIKSPEPSGTAGEDESGAGFFINILSNQKAEPEDTMDISDERLEYKSNSSDTCNPNRQPEGDEDVLFGQAIAAELKRVKNRKVKMKLKVDIYNLLYQSLDS